LELVPTKTQYMGSDAGGVLEHIKQAMRYGYKVFNNFAIGIRNKSPRPEGEG
jgi:hypothetical protein